MVVVNLLVATNLVLNVVMVVIVLYSLRATRGLAGQMSQAANLAFLSSESMKLQIGQLVHSGQQRGIKADLDVAKAEDAAALVAENLVKAQSAVDGVATNLAGAEARADLVVGEPPGSAADAASQSGNTGSEDPSHR